LHYTNSIIIIIIIIYVIINTMYITAKNAGHIKVSISYEHELFDLRATIVIAAYRPILLYHQMLIWL